MTTTDMAELDAVLAPTTANRRTRLAKDIPANVRTWLHGVARVHAQLCHCCRLFADPSRAGGEGNEGAMYQLRLEKGDRTVVYDFVTTAIDELETVRSSIQSEMDSAPPTDHAPGDHAKVAVMRQRADDGFSLFQPGDRPIDVS